MKSTNLQFPTQAHRLLFTLVAVLVGHIGVFAQDLTVNFDTQYLGTFATPAGGSYGVWSNGSTVSDTNINVSFQWSAAGDFSAMIGGQLLTSSNSTQGWTYGGSVTTSLMSPSFTVNQLNQGGGFSISEIHGQNMYIEYGTNTIGGSTPPGPPNTSRYTDVEFTFWQGGSNNNADLTAINNIGAATRLSYAGTTTTNSSSVGLTGYTSVMLPYIASQLASQVPSPVMSASTPTATPALGGGQYVAGVQGASAAAGTGFYTSYPAVIAKAVAENISTPLLTNCPGGDSPTPAQYNLGQGFTGNVTGSASLYQVSMAFTPTFSLTANGTYQITFNGTITAVVPGYAGGPVGMVTYGSTANPLSITVAGDPTSFYGYLSNGDVNPAGVQVTLGGNGTAWSAFSTDFYNGGMSGGTTLGTQGAPNAIIAGGGNYTNNTADYGQIVQRVLGDFQELAMIGAFGNTSNGTGAFANTKIGNIPSYDIFQDKWYAYNSTGIDGYNTIGQYLWLNSENITNGNGTIGAIYSNPYDDRFGSNAVSINMDPNGGTLTVQLMEVVPEPSAVALLTVAAATISIFARRRHSAATRARD
ncbi:MAG: hypothetical protein WCO94_07485 [Verrucomicrobiota bacterium]